MKYELADFHEDYRPHKYVIIAALVSAELKKRGVDSRDEGAIRQLMLQLLDHSSSTSLSTTGLRLINRWAEGGYRKIKEVIPEPNDLDLFLKKFSTFFVKEVKRN